MRNGIFNYLRQQKIRDTQDEIASQSVMDSKNELITGSVTASTFMHRIILVLRREASGSGNVRKIRLIIDLLVLLLACPAVQVYASDVSLSTAALELRLCLKSLVALLSHRYPSVRKYVAEQLYLLLISHQNAIALGRSQAGELGLCGFVDEASKLEQVTQLLLETRWEDVGANVASKVRKSSNGNASLHLAVVRRARDAIAALLSFDVTVTSVAMTEDSTSNSSAPVADESDSYESLVREAGY